MLIGRNLSLFRILKFTWKVDLLMIAFCGVVYLLDVYWWTAFRLPIAFPALMGTAIAFFIGFNNNQAYNRWWEARMIWGGIVNDSRSLARNLVAYNLDSDAAKRIVRRHLGFLYALTASLRKYQQDESHLQYITADDVEKLKSVSHIPNKLLSIQSQEIKNLRVKQQISDFEFTILNHLIENLCEAMGKSERINNTVFPSNYIFFTKLFIWLFIALITMASNSVGAAAIILGWAMGFVFNTSNMNGLYLMNPFEHQPSGVPISSITRNIEINLLQEIGADNIPSPLPVIDGEYIL
jgi:putative membrane protein